MDRTERELRLKTLAGHLLSKYDLSHHSCSHICFNIKPQDVIDIVRDYQDVLIDSNLYVSPGAYGLWMYNFDSFKVSATDLYLNIESKEYDRKNHFSIGVRMDEVEKIEIDISCNVILSLHFYYADTKRCDQISFRND